MSFSLDAYLTQDLDPDDGPQPCSPECRRYAEALTNKGYALQTEIDRLTGQDNVLLRTWQIPEQPANVRAVTDETGTVWVHASGDSDYWIRRPTDETSDDQAKTWAELLCRGTLVDATAQIFGGAS